MTTFSRYIGADGRTMVVESFKTSGSMRINDQRHLYSIAGKRVLKADALAFIASAVKEA